MPKVPGRLDGRYELSGTPAGSLLVHTTCKVSTPLIGGTLEDLILAGMRQLFDGEQRFTAEWGLRPPIRSSEFALGGFELAGAWEVMRSRCAWVLLAAADRAWASVAGHGVFGPRIRWRAMLNLPAAEGLPVEPPRRRRRDGVLTVLWSTVAP